MLAFFVAPVDKFRHILLSVVFASRFGKENVKLDMPQTRSRRLKTERSDTVFSETGGAEQ